MEKVALQVCGSVQENKKMFWRQRVVATRKMAKTCSYIKVQCCLPAGHSYVLRKMGKYVKQLSKTVLRWAQRYMLHRDPVSKVRGAADTNRILGGRENVAHFSHCTASGRHLLEKLALSCTWIPNNANIYIPTKRGSFPCCLGNATEQHQQDATFYFIIA